MYSCSQVTTWIASDEGETAGPLRRLGIRLHLALCEDCSRYRDQLKALGAAAREVTAPLPDSGIESTKGRILNKLQEKP